jgi:hypothetical protein
MKAMAAMTRQTGIPHMVHRRSRRRPTRSIMKMLRTVKIQLTTATTLPTAIGLENPTMSKRVEE